MAGTEQKQLLALIRDFASEKWQGERRLSGLKKRIQELQSEISNEDAELDRTKRSKETAENKLKGYEVELAMLDGSFQTHEVFFGCSISKGEVLFDARVFELFDARKFEK
ncbi:hypothetical protein LINGRAHAP2_LOCUS19942 [Linum grandiflorum]